MNLCHNIAIIIIFVQHWLILHPMINKIGLDSSKNYNDESILVQNPWRIEETISKNITNGAYTAPAIAVT